MRITNNLVLSQASRDLTLSLRRLNDLQMHVAATKRILKPEDDPFGAEKAIGLRSALRLNDSHMRILESGRDWMSVTEGALQTIQSSIERAYVIALAACNDTLGDDERALVSEEVEGLLSKAVTAANTRHHNRYVFSGLQTNTQPFVMGTVLGAESTVADTVLDFSTSEVTSGQTELATGTYYVEIQDSGGGNMQFRLVDDTGSAVSIYDAATDDGTTFTSDWQDVGDMLANYADGVVDTGRGLTVTFDTVEGDYAAGTMGSGAASVEYIGAFDVVYNGDGRLIQLEIEVGHTVVVNLPGDDEGFAKSFAALKNLLADLRSTGTTGDMFKNSVDDLEEASNALLQQTAAFGSRERAVDEIEQRLGQLDISLQDQLSKVEDLDMAEAILHLTNQEVAYQALLQVAARLSQPLLIEFLR